jgi:hypothetical protein
VYKSKAAGSTLRGFDIDFFPLSAPNPEKLATYLNVHDDRPDDASDTWDDNEIARYEDSGDHVEIYLAAPKPLPIPGVNAVELYPSQVLNTKSVVVRVDSLAQSSLQKVVDYYEQTYNHPEGLTVYFTASDTKWRKYPRVYPRNVPTEVPMVYSRYKDMARFMPGAQFK